MTAEEKQASRLASYAKLTLKPQQQPHERPHNKQRADGGSAGEQQQQQGSKKRRRDQVDAPASQQPVGRLASVPVDTSQLTKAQRKNLLRSLKRKEKRGGGGEGGAVAAK
jgi:hypothetical protein